MDKKKNVNIKYVVPVGSRITRKFYCPILKEDISLSEEFTEQELVFNSNDLDRVDSGFNFSYFRFIVGNTNYDGSLAVKKFDVCYSVEAKYIEIKKEATNAKRNK